MKRKILPSSKWFFAFFTLFAFFTSCRKNEINGPNNQPSKEELQKNFFNTSTTTDIEIKELAANIQKQKSLLNSLPEFVRKNGIPKWDKVLYQTKPVSGSTISTNSLKTNSVGSNGATKGVFLIPLQDENSREIKSYITAYKHNDSLYTYRLYNKDSLNNVHPSTNATRNNLLNTQAVFGYFEKTINNTDSVNVLSPVKASIKNAKIHFADPTSGSSVNGNTIKPMSEDGCLMMFYIQIDYSLTIFSDGSYIESFSVTLSVSVSCSGGGDGLPGEPDPSNPNNSNNWWNYGTGWPYNTTGGPNFDPNYYPGSYGYYNPNWTWWWTGGGGVPNLQSFVNTFSAVELNFWNDQANFLVVIALTDRLNQENFSPQVQDFVKWAIDYLIANPSVPIDEFINEFLTPSEGPEDAADITFWDDPNNTFPRQTLPTLAAFQAAFPKRSDRRYGTSSQLYTSIGGDVLAKVGNRDGVNTCAARVSKALIDCKVTIPYIPGQTFKGNDGNYYFLGAENLNRWMRKTFGCANPNTAIGEYFNAKSIHYDVSQIGFYGLNLPSLLKGIKGIYSMVSHDPVFGTGHSDLMLMNSTPPCDGGCHFDGPVKYIDVWPLQ